MTLLWAIYEAYDNKLTWETKHDDLDINEMLDIWEKLMISLTYHPDSIKRAIVEKAEEYAE